MLNRVIFLPAQEGEDYAKLLSPADVLLDTLHHSAGLTAYDAFSLGLPIMTLPGEFGLGRYTLGCYRKMGIEGLVADCPDQYLQIAVRLGLEQAKAACHSRKSLQEFSKTLGFVGCFMEC